MNDSDLVQNTLGISCLLAGMTVAARMPRLVNSLWWKLFGVGVFLVGAFGYMLVERGAKNRIGEWFRALNPAWVTDKTTNAQTIGILVVAAALVAVSWLFCRWKRGNLAVFISSGAVVIGGLVIRMIMDGKANVDGKTNAGEGPAIWPTLLAGAAFLYLWWLAALLFDLAFVWHRYVRHNTMNDEIRDKYKAAEKAEGKGKSGHKDGRCAFPLQRQPTAQPPPQA